MTEGPGRPIMARALILITGSLLLGAAAPEVRAPTKTAAGEYLVTIGGCNDCHTQKWNISPGQVPPTQRLTGNPVGWRGPWGTSYAINLRKLVSGMTEDAWLQHIANMQPKPPMPAFSMKAMSEADLRAVYAYIRSLGPNGDSTPEDLAPGELPRTSYVEAVPQMPKPR